MPRANATPIPSLAKRLVLISAVVVGLSAEVSFATAKDRVVLRDFTVLRDASIQVVGVDGLVLSQDHPPHGKAITWDEVESVSLADATAQHAAQQQLQLVGLPLYRLRVRLELGDDHALLAPAESLFDIYKSQRSVSAYMVLQSLAWGRIAHGEREAALEPWLLAYEVLRSRTAKVSDLPGSRRPRFDPPSALLAELEPVWFDAKAAQSELPKATAALASLADPVPSGARLYVASLALAAGELATADPLLESEVPPQSLSAQLQEILRAQRELLQKQPAAAIDRLQRVWRQLHAEPTADQAKSRIDYQPLALLWLARSQLAADKPELREEGLLNYMKIVAVHETSSPTLAAAALYEAADAYRGQPRIAARLRLELQNRFPNSWQTRQLTPSAAVTR